VFIKFTLLSLGRETNSALQGRIAYRHKIPGLQIGPAGGRASRAQTNLDHFSRYGPIRKMTYRPAPRDLGMKLLRPPKHLVIGARFSRRQSDEVWFAHTQDPRRCQANCDSAAKREIDEMSFAAILDQLPRAESPLLRRFARLIEPNDGGEFERMAQEARALTRQNFGKTMRMFAPLYLSNECINNCRYCGFSRDNPILRVTLTVDQVVAEAQCLATHGFRHVLLVAGEHPKFVSESYLADCIRALRPLFSSIAVELGPMTTIQYEPLIQAGAEGLVVYQETYNRSVFAEMHTSGPKRDFDWRLECPERAYAAGFRRIGIGALFGLAPWRAETRTLAAHLEYLLKHCWQSELTVSLPRLRPAAGEFVPPYSLGDRELAQLICAFRICFPHVGIVLSTREPAALRDALVPLGVTMMSSGSHTEPGGYTGQGRDAVHRTVRGRILAPDAGIDALATGQFEISDARSPLEVANALRERGFEPVWKDWDQVLLGQ
jgi:2-iminoacetate synthase